MCREVEGKICDRASTLKASGLLSQQKIAIVMAFAAELRRSLKCATELRSELSSELPTMQPLPAQALPEQLPAGRDSLSTLHGLSGIPSLGASPRPEIYVDCVTGSGFQTFVCCIAALLHCCIAEPLLAALLHRKNCAHFRSTGDREQCASRRAIGIGIERAGRREAIQVQRVRRCARRAGVPSNDRPKQNAAEQGRVQDRSELVRPSDRVSCLPRPRVVSC